MFRLGVLALVVVACADSGASTTSGPSPTSTVASEPAGTAAPQPDQEANRLIVVRNLVTEEEADAALALLAENGFEGFIKQSSAELADVSAEGWDVVMKGLTSSEATDIVIRLGLDPDVPYSGVIFVED